jgi:hypothetical protein
LSPVLFSATVGLRRASRETAIVDSAMAAPPSSWRLV